MSRAAACRVAGAIRSTLVFWVFAILFVTAVTVSAILYVWVERRTEAIVEIEAAYSELELALASVALRVASMASILERTPEITPEEFTRAFAETAEVAPRRHERAIALVPVFDDGDMNGVDRLVATLDPQYRAAGYPDFALFPRYEAGPLAPTILAEPAAARPGVFGFNFASSPERFEATRRAMSGGTQALTAPVTLSQDGGVARTSFLLVQPVGAARAPDGTAIPAGVIAAGLTPESLFEYHVPLFEHVDVAIEIGIDDTPSLPVTLAGGADGSRVSLVRGQTFPDIELPGMRVRFDADAALRPRPIDAWPPLFAFVFSILLLVLLVRQLGARERQRIALEETLRRKEAELSIASEHRARAARLEALGRLVGGVAHDFNNILSVVMGNIELMPETGPDQRRQLETDAIEAARRGAYLTKQLLAFGRRSHLRPVSVDLEAALVDTTQMLRRVLPASIELTTTTEPGLWPTEVDPDGLQNALLNLALNARDAMDGRGALRIEASNLRVTGSDAADASGEEIAPGRYVSIAVTDDGAGMPREVLDRAFEPFFSTKHKTEGSGMGLPSVLGFCRQSGGTCRLSSEPGAGTTVQMLLPAGAPPEAAGDAPEGGQAPAPAAHILLAEDEEAVGRVMQRQLERAGYAVTFVRSGDAAAETLGRGERFDLLVTDMVMAGDMQGADLARLVAANWPDMRVLMVSGYPRGAEGGPEDTGGAYPVLSKPVPRDTLIEAVADALAAGRPRED